MPFVRAIAPSALLFCLTVAAMFMLADELSVPQSGRASQAVLSAISPQEIGGDEAEPSRWIDPPRRPQTAVWRRRPSATNRLRTDAAGTASFRKRQQAIHWHGGMPSDERSTWTGYRAVTAALMISKSAFLRTRLVTRSSGEA